MVAGTANSGYMNAGVADPDCFVDYVGSCGFQLLSGFQIGKPSLEEQNGLFHFSFRKCNASRLILETSPWLKDALTCHLLVISDDTSILHTLCNSCKYLGATFCVVLNMLDVGACACPTCLLPCRRMPRSCSSTRLCSLSTLFLHPSTWGQQALLCASSLSMRPGPSLHTWNGD